MKRTGPSLAPLIAAGAVLVALHPVLLGRCLAGGDFAASFEPLASALADGVARGDLSRTPRLFAGLPLLAHPVVAAAYPPQLLVACAQPAWMLSLLGVAHLAAAAAGMAALLLRFGRSTAAAAAGGILLGLCGVAVSSLLQPNLVRPLAWLPWLLVLVDAAARAADRRRRAAAAAGLALVTALLLLCAEPFLALPAAAGAIALAWPSEGRRPPAPLAGLCAGALLALPLLLPMAAYARATVRSAGFSPEGAAQWSLHPLQLISFVVPRPFGDPLAAGLEAFTPTALVPGRSSEYFLSSHLGMLAVGLAIAGLVAGGRRETLAALALGACLLAALGSHGPVQPLLDACGIDWLRYPVKWMLPAMVPLAVLVSAGIDALATSSRARVALLLAPVLPALVAVGAAPLGAHVASLAPTQLPAPLREALSDAAHDRLIAGASVSAGFALAAAIMALLALRRGMAPARVAGVVAVLLALDVGTQAARVVPWVDAALYREEPAVVRALRAEPMLQRAWVDAASLRATQGRRARALVDLVAGLRESGLFYAPSSHGVPLALPVDMEGLAPLRMHELSELADGLPWRERLMLLGAAGVTHVVTADASAPGFEAAVVETRDGARLRVLRNPFALPIARVVAEMRAFHGSGEFASLLRAEPATLFAGATLVGAADEPSDDLPAAAAGWHAEAQVVERSAGGVRIDVRGDGGCLVLADAFLPGTTATLDGAPAAAFPADHAFTGVLVPPGRHEVLVRWDSWRP